MIGTIEYCSESKNIVLVIMGIIAISAIIFGMLKQWRYEKALKRLGKAEMPLALVNLTNTTNVTEITTPIIAEVAKQPYEIGFEAVFAIAGLLAVAYLVLRQKE